MGCRRREQGKKGEREGLTIDILLNLPQLNRAPLLRLLNHLRNEIRMRDRLSTLHNPHNRRLSLVLSVLMHPLMRLLIFFLRFLQLDLIDLDPVLGICESEVRGKGVVVIDLPSFGMFCKHTELGTGERLQGSLELGVDEAGGILNVFVGEISAFCDVVEEDENDGLEGGNEKLFRSLLELSFDYAVGESVFPG